MFGIPGEENIHLVDALSRSSDPLRAGPPRAGRVVHGRDLRTADRPGRGVLGHARPRRDQPAARRRRRDHQLHAAGRAVGAGRHGPQLQGVAPGRRPGVDVRAGDQVVGAGRDAGRGARDDPQGVQARPDRAARRGLSGRARGRRAGRRPAGAEPLPVNVPRADEPSRRARWSGRPRMLRAARNPIVLAGHGAARAGAGPALRRFAETLGVSVATTFHGKGVFPDDHPQALGAVGFMRHDYVNFGFDQADVIVTVGYELQEFDPVADQPARRQEDHPHPPLPRRGRPRTTTSPSGCSPTSGAASTRWPPRSDRDAPAPRPTEIGSAACWPTSSTAASATTGSRWPRPGSWPTPGRRWAATTSCWSTPAR